MLLAITCSGEFMFRKIYAAAISAALLAATATAQTMTNQTVVDLAKAKMSDDVIISAVNGGAPGFDTSAKGLITLKNAGVSDRVIQAVIARSSGGGSTGGAVTNGVNPEEVIVIDNDVARPMQYLTPQIRTAARALGFGGVAQYASLRSISATLRVSSQPTFQIAVPNNAQPESYFTLANFATRNNGTREVMIGGGYLSYSSGIHKDRVVATTSQKAPDQSKAPVNFTIYEIKPVSQLPRGEYAVVLYSSQVRSAGYFMSGLDSYFDFGVD